MNLMSIDSYIQQIVKGAIIAFAVIWDITSKSRQTYKKENNEFLKEHVIKKKII